jgi:DNA-binding NarL/FixJ family response regulator
MTAQPAAQSHSQSQQPNSMEPLEKLSEREREIAWLVSFALTDREIAGRLFISVDTVRSHIFSIRSKYNLRNRTDVCRWVLVRKYERNITVFSDVL